MNPSILTLELGQKQTIRKVSFKQAEWQVQYVDLRCPIQEAGGERNKKVDKRQE